MEKKQNGKIKSNWNPDCLVIKKPSEINNLFGMDVNFGIDTATMAGDGVQMGINKQFNTLWNINNMVIT